MFALSYLKLKGLNDNGQRLAGQVVGLKRYMEDFSDFRDRGVADLTLLCFFASLLYFCSFCSAGIMICDCIWVFITWDI